MRQINPKWDKLMDVFFEYPQDKFTLRELSKKTKIPVSSLQRYLKKLQKFGIINSENLLVSTAYVKHIKMSNFIDKLYISGLLDYLNKELQPTCIILFGSVRKGEYDKNSDVDIFIACLNKKELGLERYEKILGHPIQLFIEDDIKKLPERLRINVINGVKLQGYFSL